MIVHHDLKQLPNFKNAVITTGAFDGVHIGHQEIITRMKQIALEMKGETVIVNCLISPGIEEMTFLGWG